MWTAEVVLACALTLLNRSADSFPPISFVHYPPADVARGAEGYVREGEYRIYLVTSSDTFVRARGATYRCGNLQAVRKIASVLAHEDWHVRYGSDEAGAYAAQLMALRAMHAGSGDPAVAQVRRAMKAVLEDEGDRRQEIGDRRVEGRR